jgi:hypothetical protein
MHKRSDRLKHCNRTMDLIGRNSLRRCWTALLKTTASWKVSFLALRQYFTCVTWFIKTFAECRVCKTHIHFASADRIAQNWMCVGPLFAMGPFDPSSFKSRQWWAQITSMCLSSLQSRRWYRFNKILRSIKWRSSTLRRHCKRLSACRVPRLIGWTGRINLSALTSQIWSH